jgi:hypothetical protein
MAKHEQPNVSGIVHIATIGTSMEMMTEKLVHKSSNGKIYNVEYYGFNFSKNMCANDFAYIRIQSKTSGKWYHNINNVHGDCYRFASVVSGDECYRANKNANNNIHKTIIDNIEERVIGSENYHGSEKLIVHVIEENMDRSDHKYSLTFEKFDLEQ